MVGTTSQITVSNTQFTAVVTHDQCGVVRVTENRSVAGYPTTSANAAITGAAGPAGVFTTTNLPTNQIWWADNATQGTGWHAIPMNVSWPTGLKTAQAGTSFSLAQTGGQSTQSFRINCAGYFAP